MKQDIKMTKDLSDMIYDLLKNDGPGKQVDINQALKKKLNDKNYKKEINSIINATNFTKKIVSSVSKDEFYLFVTGKEIPTLKLSKQEMELAKGGWIGVLRGIAVVLDAVDLGAGLFDSSLGDLGHRLGKYLRG